MVTAAGFEIIDAVDAVELRRRYLGGQPALRLPRSNLYVVARVG